jgi:hypothetical protein
MDLAEIKLGGTQWIDLAQDMDHWSEHNNDSSGSNKCWEVLELLHN